jgi:predicted Zn-dependent protease
MAALSLAVLCAIGGTSAAAISNSEERELGKTFALEARRKLPMVDDIEVQAYVDAVGQRIAAALDEQTFAYQFAVLKDPRLNAFAVPGGYIYVHGGLLTQVGNDDELAGVLGHEIAHVHAHHLARQQEATQLMNYASLLGMLLSVVQPAIGAGAVAASATAQLQYRREFEQEADYIGARYMRRAGYDPRGMLDFFKKMADAQRSTPSLAPYLLSHPLTDKRLDNLEAVLKTHQWDEGARRPPSLELERAQLLVRARSTPPQEVVNLYRRNVEERPEDGRKRYLLGLAYLETGFYDAAVEQLEQARTLGFVEVDRELGRAWLRLRNPAKALELLSRAAETHPDDPVAQFELGSARQISDDMQGAMRAYRRAIELAPNLEAAHYALGLLAGRAGLEGDGFYHLGKAFKLRGDFDKALTQFEKAEPLLPAGSDRAREVRGEISDLASYLGKGKP